MSIRASLLVAGATGSAFETPKPIPAPSSKRVEVDLYGANSKTSSGMNCQVASTFLGLVKLKFSDGASAKVSLDQYLIPTTPVVPTSCEPGMTPTPKPSEPDRSSADFGARAIGPGTAVGGVTEGTSEIGAS